MCRHFANEGKSNRLGSGENERQFAEWMPCQKGKRDKNELAHINFWLVKFPFGIVLRLFCFTSTMKLPVGHASKASLPRSFPRFGLLGSYPQCGLLLGTNLFINKDLVSCYFHCDPVAALMMMVDGMLCVFHPPTKVRNDALDMPSFHFSTNNVAVQVHPAPRILITSKSFN